MRFTELVDLASSSLFEIGAHTVTHPVLAAQSAQDQHWEVHASKLWLERLLGRAITSISYPYGGRGHYNQATLAAVAQAGYQRALTTVPAAVCRRSPHREWGRFVVSDMDGGQFQEFLSSLLN